MQTVVFVHGTGVREPAFTNSFNLVQTALGERLGAPNVRVETCYWGGACGSDLFLGGASIPEFDTTRAVGEGDEAGEDPEEYERSLWALLYDDPFAELDLLALRGGPGGEAPPGQEPPGEELDRRARKLTAEGAGLETAEAREELADLLTAAGLTAHFAAARGDVVDHPSYKKAVAGVVEPLTDYRLAVARAILAQCVRRYREDENLPEGYLPLDGAARDRIVELLVAALGGREAGVVDWVKEKAGGLVKRAGTRWFKRRRGRFSDQFAPFGADILVYQARPRAIRDFIRKTVEESSAAAKNRGGSGEVALIAHSLGGIAAVDTLIEAPLSAVRHLITVGSQAPLLYELDALGSLPLKRAADGKPAPPPHPLPDHFPKSYLNIYDPRDFLSYKAEAVFGNTRVRDVAVDNGQPFPESHSAYWMNKKVWEAVVDRLQKGA